jgi:four helix bundle protein
VDESIVHRKSYAFAVRIVRLSQFLHSKKQEFVLSRQILRSGTAVGALLSEAKYAQSRADFINKLQIAIKEANESLYWLRLLKDTDYIDAVAYKSMEKDNREILKLLTAIINTTKNNQ